MPKPLEIFRTGTHTAMSGDALTFSEADLAATAKAYDPAKHEAPICVGHPRHDDPAYGWVKAVSAAEGRLLAQPTQVEEAFAEMVEKGRFKKISASFYRPDAAGNPVPGVYYLRHVGFLGAQAPSVKGLKPASFAAGEAGTVTVEFGDPDGLWLARALRGLRDWILGRFGQEEADKALPPWLVDSLQNEAARTDSQGTAPAFLEPTPTRKEAGMPDDKTTDPTKSTDSDLASRKADLEAREAAFAEREAKARREELAAFAEGLVKEGRILPAEKAGLVEFMAKLESKETVSFAEGTEKTTALGYFKAFLAGRAKLVEFAEKAGAKAGDPASVEFAAPAGFAVDPEGAELHARAVAYQSTHPNTPYLTAVKAVGGK